VSELITVDCVQVVTSSVLMLARSFTPSKSASTLSTLRRHTATPVSCCWTY